MYNLKKKFIDTVFAILNHYLIQFSVAVQFYIVHCTEIKRWFDKEYDVLYMCVVFTVCSMKS